MGEVLYNPRASANVLSWSRLEEQGYRLSYDSDERSITVHTNQGDHVFTNSNGHYVSSSKEAHTLIAQVSDNERNFSPRELTSARKAKELVERLGFPSPEAVKEALRRGTINNVPVTTQDVTRAYAIYGPDIPSLKGKTTTPPPSPANNEMVHHIQQTTTQHGTLSIDTMSINGELFLIGVIDEIDMTLSAYMSSKSSETLLKTVNKFLASAKANH